MMSGHPVKMLADSGDLFAFTEEILRLIRARCLDEAEAVANRARQREYRAEYSGRSQGVHEITLALAQIRRQKSRIEGAIARLPDDLELPARQSLWPIIDDVFSPEVARLKGQKRQLSNPRR